MDSINMRVDFHSVDFKWIRALDYWLSTRLCQHARDRAAVLEYIMDY
jgi:hypothetical protein